MLLNEHRVVRIIHLLQGLRRRLALLFLVKIFIHHIVVATHLIKTKQNVMNNTQLVFKCQQYYCNYAHLCNKHSTTSFQAKLIGT